MKSLTIIFLASMLVFVSGFLALADGLDCELGLCDPARSTAQVDSSGKGFYTTAEGAKSLAVQDAIYGSCISGKEKAREELECPDPKNCKLHGVVEYFPKKCNEYAQQYPQSDIDSWDSVTVTNGTYIDFLNQCVDYGIGRDQCIEAWVLSGFRYFATATAAVEVKAKQLCLSKTNGCVDPMRVRIEERLGEDVNRSAESGSIF